MSKLTRNVRSDNNLSLHHYTPSSPSSVSSLDVSLPQTDPLRAFQVIFRAGFITSLGCICCIPILTTNNVVTLAVNLDRLKIVAKALLTPLFVADINLFLKSCIRNFEISSGLWYNIIPSCLLQQHSKINRADKMNYEKRSLFLEKFRQHKGATSYSSVDLAKCWGRAVGRESISETALRMYCTSMNISYREGVEWGLDWEYLQVSMRPNILVEFDEEYMGKNVGETIFLKGEKVPGPPLDFNKPDNPCNYLQEAFLSLLKQEKASNEKDKQKQKQVLDLLAVDGRAVKLPTKLLIPMSTN